MPFEFQWKSLDTKTREWNGTTRKTNVPFIFLFLTPGSPKSTNSACVSSVGGVFPPWERSESEIQYPPSDEVGLEAAMEEMGSFEGNGYGESECLLNAGWANDFTQLTPCGYLKAQIQAFFR